MTGAGHCWRRRREEELVGRNENCSILVGSDSLYSWVYVALFMKNWAQFTGDLMFSLEGEIGAFT